MICTVRIPDVLQARIDAAAGDDGRSKWILEACRMRLDNGVRSSEARAPKGTLPQGDGPSEVAGSNPVAAIKPNMQELRDIAAGKTPGINKDVYPSPTVQSGSAEEVALIAKSFYTPDSDRFIVEIPICGKTWWEDGNGFECLMDRGHKSPKHGLGGMVRKLED